MGPYSSDELPPVTTELEIKSILLVDDDPDFADALRALLESRNFVVTSVPNGAAALHEVLALDFDVIICDLLMPHMPGDMFYLAVQKVKPRMAKRFVFITGQSGKPNVDAFLKQIDARVLFKPVHTEDLIQAIALVLRETSREQVS